MSCDPASERRGEFPLLSFLLEDLRNAKMEEERGTDGVDPEEEVSEKASAHSYRRYVCCIVSSLCLINYY